MRLIAVFFIALLGFTAAANAQKQCVKGIPCGNTCIAATKTCRVGSGSATARPLELPKASAPVGAQYVASNRGQVYYWLGCNAWQNLSTANLVYFKTAKEASEAGYRPSASSGCAGPSQTGDTVKVDGKKVDGEPDPARVMAGVINRDCVVTRVIDGDTFECRDGNRVRLLLLDAPEMDQGAFGPVARAKLLELLPLNTMVSLELDFEERDRYGRVLAYVHNGRTFVNHELLRSGMAVISIYPPNLKHLNVLRAAVDTAKSARAGLWATNAFECAPADHRAGKCH